jgi:hypothetical protein
MEKSKKNILILDTKIKRRKLTILYLHMKIKMEKNEISKLKKIKLKLRKIYLFFKIPCIICRKKKTT